MNYEQIFKRIDEALWKEAGCSNEIDYVEQTSWLLFLKYLDDLEESLAEEALLEGEDYHYIIDEEFRWHSWAAPLKADGSPDYEGAMSGDDLTDFVTLKLFPYLKGFKKKATDANTLVYKVGEIFGELTNKIRSGYNLRDILWEVNQLEFLSDENKHEISVLYESKLNRMGNAGRNGGEYYTPRPLERVIVKVIDPKIGETIEDPNGGSMGFLCEAFSYLQGKVKSTADEDILQKQTFYGKELKALAYILGTMNMIFHGVLAPNIVHGNTLTENVRDIQPKDQKDIILTNPPFGAKERDEVKKNFLIETGETAYLFLQYYIKKLKAGGRAGVVIKNTFLSNTDNASIALRKMLLEECNLHTILDLPQGVFQAGVKTVVLFFEKGKPTKETWYYQLNLDRKLGKTKPLTEADLAEFVALYESKADSDNSWTISADSLSEETYDLSVKNPNKNDEVVLREPEEIFAEMKTLVSDIIEIMEGLKV
ncbi:MAG: type I restriction-modification system subunit M [Bacteroidaceae bacterium]|nr:type I restriction-modification system subunit M [Bacteroidaceae bacterium]